jgi:hypothetical protein
MYDLHNLGWHSFQQLCLTIAREIFGQTLESFLDSTDAGKDGAFAGTWVPFQGEALSGRFVIQCKFTGKRDKHLSLSDLTDEVQKAARLVNNGRCDCYVLMTNAGLSGSICEDIEKLFRDAGVKDGLHSRLPDRQTYEPSHVLAANPGLFLNTVSEVNLVIQLHELGLFSEKYRKEFVTTVTSYAIDGEDLYAIESQGIQSVFTPDELFEFRARVRAELVPNLATVRRTWQSNHSSGEPADEHMQPLFDSFSALKEEFADEPTILSDIDADSDISKERAF